VNFQPGLNMLHLWTTTVRTTQVYNQQHSLSLRPRLFGLALFN